MNPLAFLRRASNGRQAPATPRAKYTSGGVIVTPATREAGIDGFAFDLTDCKVDLVRDHLPNRPRPPEAPLRAALVARAYRPSLRAGRRLSDEEGTALANAIDELSAFALERAKGRP
jgi:hypothetical protein